MDNDDAMSMGGEELMVECVEYEWYQERREKEKFQGEYR